uniref:Ubiquitin-like domain-containing protein n=1 Tax=Lotharella globosa TaxID=91324 RepID=A0A7S3YE58_9EUKA
MADTLSYQSAPGYHVAPHAPEEDVKIKVTVFSYRAPGSRTRDDAKILHLYVPPSNTVLGLKRLVRSQTGHIEQHQTAIYKGQVLHDGFVMKNVPGLCGEGGTTAHVRIVLRNDDLEGPAHNAFTSKIERESDPMVVKSDAPPPGYFHQQSIFRRHSPHGSFTAQPVIQLPRELGEETALVRKVYAALSLQMLATTVISAMFMFYEPLNSFVLKNTTTVFYGSSFLGLGILIGLYCFKAKYPTNLYLLIGFTVAMSCEIGTICAVYSAAGMAELILQASVYTAAIFGALTIYAFTTRVDLRSWGPYLFVGLIVLVLWGLVSMLFGFQQNWFYSLGGALLFSAYILYDTSRV